MSTRTSSWSGWGAVASALGFSLSWFCCLPFAAALGAGIAAAGSFLTPFQPYLATLSILFLGVAFVQQFRARRCEADGTCEPRTPRRRWLFLILATVLTVILITLPYWSSTLIYWSL